MSRTDFKKGLRIKDRTVTQKVVQLFPFCAACGGCAETGDHVIRKSQQGDDVIANVVSLCGHGTAGCHGAKHGSPYIGTGSDVEWGGRMEYAVTERRDARWVAVRVGETLIRERRDVLWYVLAKLGVEPGLDFLERIYKLDPIRVRYLPGFPA